MIILGLIPARGGSKGIPRKNELPLAGRTLIERTADAARASGVVDRLVLTTDSDEVAAIGSRAGIDTIPRPAELANDEAPMLPVVLHALETLSAAGWTCDAVALLQPTQPLRTGPHIRAAVNLLEERGATAVVSVVPIPPHYAPEYAMRIDAGRLLPYLDEGAAIIRRQDAAPAFSRDGTIYLTRVDVLRRGSLYGEECLPLVISPSESANLDTYEDWARAEELLAR